MSTVELDLWPASFGLPETELPDAILREQADLLGEKTNHLVEARVAAPEHAMHLTDKIRFAFYLVAPKLGNYNYRLFTIEYGIERQAQRISGYPVTVLNGEAHICQDKNAFLEALREVFASQTTVQIISTLMNGSSGI